MPPPSPTRLDGLPGSSSGIPGSGGSAARGWSVSPDQYPLTNAPSGKGNGNDVAHNIVLRTRPWPLGEQQLPLFLPRPRRRPECWLSAFSVLDVLWEWVIQTCLFVAD